MGTKTKDQASVSAPRPACRDDAQSEVLTPMYARFAFETPVPKFELPDREMDPRRAYQHIPDELMLDGNHFEGRSQFRVIAPRRAPASGAARWRRPGRRR